ncbi:unnamed protein product [Owenia fusiformis]|uniref:Uncharacterized protein n=1 Tax=Owenia fusiformis TaxID=6347 RepID=A0A8J1Y4S5_OWEFU|nr:unnamed protein product [Owenia fusiformis]
MTMKGVFICLSVLVTFAVARPNYNGERHMTLGDDITANKRVFVVGDVHGCLDELRLLLERADVLNRDRNTIKSDAIVVFAGDITNRGPRNLDTLKFVRKSGAYQVRGNHEDNLNNNPNGYSWFRHASGKDRRYLQSLPYTITISRFNTVVVHAGLLPGKPIHEQSRTVMTRMRNIAFDNFGNPLPIERPGRGREWARYWNGPQDVVFGHDAARNLQIRSKSIGLDTNCWRGGRLTGVFLPISARNIVSKGCGNYCPPDGSNC